MGKVFIICQILPKPNSTLLLCFLDLKKANDNIGLIKSLGTSPSPNWPEKGEIRIDNISARYAKDLDAVLMNVSVHLKAGEKVRYMYKESTFQFGKQYLLKSNSRDQHFPLKIIIKRICLHSRNLHTQ